MCQITWIQISPDFLSSQIWVQTVCKSDQQTTLGDEELTLTLLTFFVQKILSAKYYVYCIYLDVLQINFILEAITMSPNQCYLKGEVWSNLGLYCFKYRLPTRE